MQQLEVLSTLSPEGTTLVVAITSQADPDGRSLHFLNIRTGELSNALVLQYDLLYDRTPYSPSLANLAARALTPSCTAL